MKVGEIIKKVFTEEQIDKITGNYKPSTLRNMWYLVRTIHNMIGFDKFTDLSKKVKEIDEKIFQNDSLTVCVKCNYIFAITGLLRMCGIEELDPRLEEMGLLLSKERSELQIKKRDDRVIKKDVTVKDIYNYVKERYKGSELWMLSILKCCPIRVSEFCGMSKIDTGDNNYIDVENMKIIVRNHKNKGIREVSLDEETIKDLKDCVHVCEGLSQKQIKDKFSYILRAYKKDNKIKSNVKLGIHEFRAQAEVENMSNLKSDMSSKELDKLLNRAKELGHTMESALIYYTAGGKSEEDEEIVKFMDHKSDESGKVVSFFIKDKKGDMRWKDMDTVDMFKYAELVSKYKRSL